jgi:aldose 1-epimerase
MKLLHLKNDKCALQVAPEVGAGVASLTWNGRNVLRPSRGQAPTDLAMFLMVPWANRLAGPDARGIAPNVPADIHPIHGSGWQAMWDVVQNSESTIVLGYQYRDSVIGFDAEVTYELEADGLRATLQVVNKGDEGRRFGLGFHPYFPRTHQTRLWFDAAAKWTEGADKRPEHRMLIARRPDPANVQVLPETMVNEVYEGFAGEARILDGEMVTVIRTRAPASQHLHLWTPPGEDFFCLEPQTHRSGDLSSEAGGQWLQPDERMALALTITASASRR